MENKYLYEIKDDASFDPLGLLSTNAPQEIVVPMWNTVWENHDWQNDDESPFERLVESINVLYPGTERVFITETIYP